MSSTHVYYQVDAFTDRPLSGNPCPVVLDADDLDEAAMQAIAREQNQSETAFVLRPRGDADVAARYFTPAEEIPLAGHPTLAVTKTLLASGRLPYDGKALSFRLELKAATVTIEVSGPEQRVAMRQPAPGFGRTYDDAAACFGLTADDLLLPAQTVSTGTPQLMLLLRDPSALARAVMVRERYLPLRATGDFFSPHLFCVDGQRTVARHFGVPPDTQEDPFTGSATGGMGCFLWHHGRLSEPRFRAEQGTSMGRPGFADVEVVGPRDAIEAVVVSGLAVVVARGELFL